MVCSSKIYNSTRKATEKRTLAFFKGKEFNNGKKREIMPAGAGENSERMQILKPSRKTVLQFRLCTKRLDWSYFLKKNYL